MVWKSRAEREGVPMPPLEVYEGDLPYIFVAYAHADRDAALPMVAALVAEGYRVWYDDGIEPAEDYPGYIADHVYRCSCFVMLVSSNSLASAWCKREADYALDLNKRILPIYLKKVELTRGLQMRMGNKQALFWYEYDSDEAFYRKLFKARRLDPCLTEEGRERRGVKARGGGPKVSATQTTGRVPEEPRADVRRNGEEWLADPHPAEWQKTRADNAAFESDRPHDAILMRSRGAIRKALNALRAGGKRLELPETYQSDRFGDYSFIEFKAIQETTAAESRADR